MKPRKGVLLATWIGTAFGSAAIIYKPIPWLVWNASPSVPTGLYAVQQGEQFKVDDLVIVIPPPGIAKLLDERGYLPLGLPLLKRVLAVAGQSVCRKGLEIVIDGAAFGIALEYDRLGRALPNWQGCRPIANGEVFLMNSREPASFDGRYFGVLPSSCTLGRAAALWIAR